MSEPCECDFCHSADGMCCECLPNALAREASLVALLRRAVVDRGEPECAVSRRLVADIRAALKAWEERSR